MPRERLLAQFAAGGTESLSKPQQGSDKTSHQIQKESREIGTLFVL